MKKVIVIGGGAAGMFAAIKAREMGANVTLLEKNGKLGKKILITGKGRCNITNACSLEEMIKNVPGNGPFLYSALHVFSNTDVVDFLHILGLPTKVERGGRIFPQSDRALDVVLVLENHLMRTGVDVRLNTPVEDLVVTQGKVTGVKTKDGYKEADVVIVATGGASYPGTGSTGDGYWMAKRAGHSIVPLKPTLVPLETAEPWVKELQGLALKNVEVIAWASEQKLGREFGELLFTHFGISGPVILTLSKPVTAFLELNPNNPVTVRINLKPALTPEQIDRRVQRDFQKYARKHFANAFSDLLPKSLIPVFIQRLPILPEKPVHQITREERRLIVDLLQDFPVTVVRPRPLSEAIVTAGGVHIKEVNPKTMESKLIRGLYFAGEVLDVDGLTGGFNLQAAFSTGFLAGMCAAE